MPAVQPALRTARTMIRATRGELVDAHALVDRVGELEPAACRPSPPGCRARSEEAHVGAAGHAGEPAPAPRSARTAARDGRAPTGASGRVSPGANAPPVHATSTGGASPSSSDGLERGARASARSAPTRHAEAALERRRRSGTELDHSPPSMRPDADRVGQRERPHRAGARRRALMRALVRRERQRGRRRSGRSRERPASRIAAWAARPRTVPRKVSAPAWAQTTREAGRLRDQAASKAASRSSAANVPSPPSSSEATRLQHDLGRGVARVAQRGQRVQRGDRRAPFMSTEPRPCTRAVRRSRPTTGRARHGSLPAPTTSTWPLRRCRPGARAGQRDGRARAARRAAPPRRGGPGGRAARRGRARAARPRARARRRSSPSRSSAARSSPVTLGHLDERGRVAGERGGVDHARERRLGAADPLPARVVHRRRAQLVEHRRRRPRSPSAPRAAAARRRRARGWRRRAP